MHPQIRQPQPGKCPLCGMDLVPVAGEAETGAAGPPRLAVTPEAKALMEIRTALVERRFPTAHIRMVGKVAYDETRLESIAAWVPGRLDRLFVDYAGVPVKQGEHMVLLYSPELLGAQEELLQALRAVRSLEASDVPIMRETAEATVRAVREKLRLWGLKPEQIQAIEDRGAANDHMTIYAPVGGTVVAKHANEGQYVQTGTPIYTIADLSHVWVKLDAYESDLAWLHYGQEAAFTSEAYPGETFTGRLAFIDPVLDPKTRTVKVRLNAPNLEGKLKPEMFVHAVVQSRIAAGGRVMDPALAGKWICTMHPGVIKDAPGACDICGMDLVTTESLGYTSADPEAAEAPLVIPASAPLVTGTRAVVYREVPDADRPTYEGVEVVLGPRAGDAYIVKSGLSEGDRVVVQGAFKIDSELQIRARPSMMNPAGGAPPAGHQHGPPDAGPAPQDAGPATQDTHRHE
ncbi:MAG: efflux RND transporter periplasmic adaptor subunit [Planctomycetes bacterium]|nr:efflux RND transporter periplasmic adaptor subunit [Planctomycetota bacterium]